MYKLTGDLKGCNYLNWHTQKQTSDDLDVWLKEKNVGQKVTGQKVSVLVLVKIRTKGLT